MAWAFGKTKDGRWFLADFDNADNRFEFDYEDMPSIAVAFAQEYTDDDMRGFVAGEWAPLEMD